MVTQASQRNVYIFAAKTVFENQPSNKARQILRIKIKINVINVMKTSINVIKTNKLITDGQKRT